MKIGLRLIVIVLKTAVAAYLIGCVGLSMVAATPARIGRVRSYPTEGASK